MRRRIRVALLAAVLGVGGTLVTVSASALTGPPGIQNQGVGMYTDLSTALQLSTFTINPRMVSCGVGTLAAGSFTGPFAMLMYSTAITEYHVDTGTNTITARGAMRSITRIAGLLAEDVPHTFVAIAVDKAAGPDRYDLFFKTPFWNQGNLLCAASNVVPGGCRFGGDVLVGDVHTS